MSDTKEKLFTKNFNTISASSFFVSWALYIMLTIFPIFLLDELQFSGTVTGTILALFPLGALLCRPLAGWLSDSFPKKRIGLLAIVSFLILGIGYFFLTNPFALAVCRVLQGFSFSIASTILSTLVLEVIPEKHLGTGVGIYSANYSLAMIVGPLTGFFIFDLFADNASYGYKAVFLGAIVSSALSLLALVMLRKKDTEVVKRPFNRNNIILKTGISTTFCLVCIAILYGLVLNFVALFAKKIGLGEYSSIFFMLMGIGLVFSRIISGYFFDKGYVFAVMVVANVSLVLVTLLFINVSSAIVYLMTSLIMGGCYGIMIPAFQALLVLFAKPNERGLASSTFFMGFDAGIMVALFGGGVIIDILSIQAAFYMGTGIQLIWLLVFILCVMPAYRALQRS